MKRYARDQGGAVLILVAVGMLAFLMLAALVVDLAALRSDIRADRLAADAATTAGVIDLDPFRGSDAEKACETAWAYVLSNLSDEGAPSSTPNCTMFAASCDSGIARTAAGAAGPYRIDIVHPVTDGHSFMAGQALNADLDGGPCQRLGVGIERDRDFSFATVAGFSSETTEVSSVARIGTGPGQGELVPLLLLEPIACDALFTSGQGKITVTYFDDTPGIMVVDSDGSKTTNPNRCGNNTWTIDSKGTQNGWIRAIPVPGKAIPSAILSYALSGAPGANPIRAYDPGDLADPVDPADISDPLEPAISHFRLYPEPIPVSTRITRAPIDWRYNCKSTYPDYPLESSNPTGPGIPVQGCPFTATRSPHIDPLRASYGDAGDVGTPPPGLGWTQWTMFHPCNFPPSDPALVVVAGNWWIDCPGGLTIHNTVTIPSGSVVADGEIRIFGSLLFNTSGGNDEIMYLRVGDVVKDALAEIYMDRTFLFLEDGIITFGGGAGPLFWKAPLGGDFEDLALWSERADQFELGGQADTTLEGTLFTPNAEPFTLTGQSGQFQTAAQFLTRRLEVKGQGEVRMKPDPDRITLVPVRAVRLIR